MAGKIKNNPTKERSLGKIMLAVFIPFIFLGVLAWVALTLSGMNVSKEVGKAASAIPGLSTFTSSNEAESTGDTSDRLEAALANKEAEINQLKQEASDKESLMEEKDRQILQLQADLEEASQPSVQEEEAEDSVKDLALSFREMDAEDAAPILQEMNQDKAVLVLKEITNKERGTILGAMESAAAAEIAVRLMDE
ncbi:MotE family protein [Halobacillus kuroshimensis]|uniref:MotE family protein n=1 Tax=Halobacillus kuroshimensis TaxID=302481 RepID=UPI0003F8C39C|nr:hypothetical protein [Halobacillus kuroshimensis]